MELVTVLPDEPHVPVLARPLARPAHAPELQAVRREDGEFIRHIVKRHHEAAIRDDVQGGSPIRRRSEQTSGVISMEHELQKSSVRTVTSWAVAGAARITSDRVEDESFKAGVWHPDLPARLCFMSRSSLLLPFNQSSFSIRRASVQRQSRGTSINIRIGRYTKLSDGWGRGDKRA